MAQGVGCTPHTPHPTPCTLHQTFNRGGEDLLLLLLLRLLLLLLLRPPAIGDHPTPRARRASRRAPRGGHPGVPRGGGLRLLPGVPRGGSLRLPPLI